MTLESIAWRDVALDPPTEADGHWLLVYGPELRVVDVVTRVWIGTRTRGGNWLTGEQAYPIEGVTHWAPMPTGAGPR